MYFISMRFESHFCTDGGSNMKKAMRTMKESESTPLYCALRCFCHLTNNCVKPTLSETGEMLPRNPVPDVMKQLKKITSHFKHSGQNSELASSLKQSMVSELISSMNFVK